jgi:hypothetical protein
MARLLFLICLTLAYGAGVGIEADLVGGLKPPAF